MENIIWIKLESIDIYCIHALQLICDYGYDTRRENVRVC